MNKTKGIAALITITVAAILSLIALLVINYGEIALKTSKQKQILDSCGINAGRKIIETNDINYICSRDFLNRCAALVHEEYSPDFECEDLGLFCDENNYCERSFNISSTYHPSEESNVTKSIKISIPEENHDVTLVDAAVVILLDFSGSMRGNRIFQLKDTVTQFVNSNFNLSFSVILYNNTIISKTRIDKGPAHKNNVLSLVENSQPGGGTSFIAPLREALSQINNSRHEAYYILLISDGSPNEGIGQSKNFVQDNILSIANVNCVYSTEDQPCVSVYSIGVDNADINSLSQISGNTLSTNVVDYVYSVNSNQVTLAFNAIISEIMCRIGPVLSNETLYIFNKDQPLTENVDYIFDSLHKIIKFYDSELNSTCTDMITSNAEITLRWGAPKFEAR